MHYANCMVTNKIFLHWDKAKFTSMLQWISCASQPVITEYTLQSLISTLLLTSSMEY